MPDYSTWLTKQQAAEVLGVSTKTIEQFALAGKIQYTRWRRPTGGMQIAVYFPEDVERLAHERNPSKPYVAAASSNGNGHTVGTVALATRPDDDVQRLVAALRAAVDYVADAQATTSTPAATTLFLTLEEAATVANLPQAYLRRAIREGKLPAVKTGGWRIRRRDLEQL